MSKEEQQALYNIDETSTTLHLLHDALEMETDPKTIDEINRQIHLCKSKLYEFAVMFSGVTPLYGIAVAS